MRAKAEFVASPLGDPILATPDQEALRQRVFEALRLGVAAHLDEWEAARTPVPGAVFAALGQAGAFADDAHAAWVLMEEAGALGAAGLTLALARHGLSALALVRGHGSAALHETWLPRLTQGEAVATLAFEEPGVAGDPRDMACAAGPSPDGWTLHGVKSPVVAGAQASLLLVLARVGEDGFGVFAVPVDRAGVHVTPLADQRGLRCAGLGTVALDGVEVTARDVLGDPARGDALLADLLPWQSLGASALVTHGAALVRAVSHGREDNPRVRVHLEELVMLRALWREAVTRWDASGTPGDALGLAAARSWRFFDQCIALATKLGGVGAAGRFPLLVRVLQDRAMAAMRPPV